MSGTSTSLTITTSNTVSESNVVKTCASSTVTTSVAITTVPQLKTVPPPALTVQTSVASVANKIEPPPPPITHVTLQTTPPAMNAVKTLTINQTTVQQKTSNTSSAPVTKLNNSVLVAQLCGKSIVLNKSSVMIDVYSHCYRFFFLCV